MIQVLIVDDQEEIIRGILSGVDWTRIPQISKVHHASCVEDSKRIFASFPIGLVITDIEMPGENGLALVAWINQFYPETKCILLTAHAKFQYAQDAVHLHCIDYLLQPIRYELLQQSIEKAVMHIEKDQFLQKDIQDAAYWRLHHENLEKNMWENFLKGDENVEPEISPFLERLNISTDRFGLLIIYATSQIGELGEWNACDSLGSEKSSLSEYLHTFANYSCIFNTACNCFSIIFSTNLSEKNVFDYLRAYSSANQSNLAIYYRYSSQIGTAASLYQELQKECGKILVPKPGLYTYNTSTNSGLGILPPAYLWCDCFIEKNTSLILESIQDSIKRNIKNGTMNRTTLFTLQQAFLYTLQSSLQKRALHSSEFMASTDVQESLSHCLDSIPNFLKFVQLILEKNKALPSDNEVPPEDAVLLAQAYIADHISESNLSRQDIAKAAHISESNLSHIFSRKAGISVTDYISQERIKLACSFLSDTSMPISLIAMKCGFNSASYFIMSFKKAKGIPPSEYRKQQEIQK